MVTQSSGEDSNSGKASKARAQGTNIIGLDDAWTLVGGRP